VTGAHPDIGPELRQLAQAILDRLDPALRTAATLTASEGKGPGKCQQVWCPVCALAALVNGEQHPLLTVIADHSVSLLGVVRAMVADLEDPARSPPEPPPDGARGDSDTDAGPDGVSRPGPGRYQHIEVTVEE
jgi:hypothetical protein